MPLKASSTVAPCIETGSQCSLIYYVGEVDAQVESELEEVAQIPATLSDCV